MNDGNMDAFWCRSTLYGYYIWKLRDHYRPRDLSISRLPSFQFLGDSACRPYLENWSVLLVNVGLTLEEFAQYSFWRFLFAQSRLFKGRTLLIRRGLFHMDSFASNVFGYPPNFRIFDNMQTSNTQCYRSSLRCIGSAVSLERLHRPIYLSKSRSWAIIFLYLRINSTSAALGSSDEHLRYWRCMVQTLKLIPIQSASRPAARTKEFVYLPNQKYSHRLSHWNRRSEIVLSICPWNLLLHGCISIRISVQNTWVQ